MKESIGFNFTLNFIIIFIFISFAVLMAIMTYSKAYKLNSRLVNEIEKCEGFNTCVVNEVNRVFRNIGYRTGQGNCPTKDGINAINRNDLPNGLTDYDYCIYYSDESNNFVREIDGDRYYRYGVTTYMYIDFPLIDNFRVPVYTRTNWIYDYENN